MVPGAVIQTEADDVDKAVNEIGLPMIEADNGVGAAAPSGTEDDVNHFKAEWDHFNALFFENLSLLAKSALRWACGQGWQHRL